MRAGSEQCDRIKKSTLGVLEISFTPRKEPQGVIVTQISEYGAAAQEA